MFKDVQRCTKMYGSSCKVSDLSRRCWDGYFRGGRDTLRSILYVSLPYTCLSYFILFETFEDICSTLKTDKIRQDRTSIAWQELCKGTQPLLTQRHSQQMLMMITTALLWARWGVADTVVRCWKSNEKYLKDGKNKYIKVLICVNLKGRWAEWWT